MARGINKVILIGNLGDEPTCRTTHSGVSVTNISMVTNEVRRNLETGENTEFAEWHRVVMWGRLADIAKQYLHKGSQVYIEGKLRTRSYVDKQGQKRSITEIVADEMQMLGTRAQGQGYQSAPSDPYAGSSAANNFSNNNNYAGSSGYAASNAGYSNAATTNAYGASYNGSPSAYGQSAYQQPPQANPYLNQQPPAAAAPNPYAQAAAAAPAAAAAVAPAAAAASAPQEPVMKMSDDEIPF